MDRTARIPVIMLSQEISVPDGERMDPVKRNYELGPKALEVIIPKKLLEMDNAGLGLTEQRSKMFEGGMVESVDVDGDSIIFRFRKEE
tara:strand:- start:70 stop:333 length:264 start_codon:yes stop_codon:yes gene_type:complete